VATPGTSGFEQGSPAPAERDTMSIFCSLNSSRGKRASHCQPRAISPRARNREAFKREAAADALDCGPQWRGGFAARSGAFRQPGPGQPCPEAIGGRGQAGANRPGDLRQGSTRTHFWHSHGTPAARRPSGRNLRSAGDPLAAGGGAAPIQRAPHHPSALANQLRYGQTSYQPPDPDRQAGGGV